jgi:hypothetical protein
MSTKHGPHSTHPTGTPMPPRPFARSFWVAPGKLLAGYYPGDLDPAQELVKLRALLAAGVRSFVDLTHELDRDHRGQPLAPYTAALAEVATEQGATWWYRRCPIVDETAPTRAVMRGILDVIDERISAGDMVYVHCWGGRGRTGTAAGCWLARHRVATGDEILLTLQTLRRRDGAQERPTHTERSQRDLVVGWGPGE